MRSVPGPESDPEIPTDGPSRRTTLRTAGVAASAAFLLPVAASVPAVGADRPRSAGGTLQRAFAAAAAEYRVPLSVLLGVSYLTSRWDGHSGVPSVAGGYGPMHLTDMQTALAQPHSHHDTGDPRGDAARPMSVRRPTASTSRTIPPRLRTLLRAADLTGLHADDLRNDDAANVRGGAALLAAEQKRLGLPLSTDPARWYAAVASYSGADDTATAGAFADEVYDVIRTGAHHTTGAGQRVSLAAVAGVKPETSQLRRLGLRHLTRDPHIEAPPGLPAEWVPAPYKDLGNGDYGNYDKANRPVSQKIDHIVIHDTEGDWETTLKLVQDPTYLGWHYTVRSADGLVAQHVATKDVGWHAGNWYINSKSIGVEHEGYLVHPDAWYTEAMYRRSAQLVRYLAARFDIPLDRQHIVGHDNVPGTSPSGIPSMHTDPGPYWDWGHYFTLLGAPFHGGSQLHGGLVTIRPDYAANQPDYTGCEKAGQACDPHGSTALHLYTAPSEDAPLVKDVGLHTSGDGTSTIDVNDVGARASTGQRFAVADQQGDWTAIWFLGQKAWFKNPAAQPTAVDDRGLVATPKDGATDVAVYGVAYPEKDAYPSGVPVQALTPLPYKLAAGQSYVVGLEVPGEYLWATTFDPSGHKVVRGKELYYEIQFGHRVAFVKAADVTVRPSGR